MWSYGKKRDPPTGPGVVDLLRREVGDLTPKAFTNLANASEIQSMVLDGNRARVGRVYVIDFLFSGLEEVSKVDCYCIGSVGVVRWKLPIDNLYMTAIQSYKDLVLRLKIHRKLNKHRGCVNTISFNASGNALVSGSDDRMILLWDWDMGTRKLAFHSGHHNNVFQAKFMPFTDDRCIVTCAADGEVRCAEIADGGRVDVKLLGNHEGRVHKIAIEPGSPHVFYSCGEDGRVLRFDLRKEHAMQLFTCKSLQEYPLKGIPIRLNAIAVDPRNCNFFAVAGSDELVRLYDIRRYKGQGSGISSRDHPYKLLCPPHLLGNAEMGITGLAFSDESELLASYGNEKIYLFMKDQGLELDQLASSSRSSEDAGSGVKDMTYRELEHLKSSDNYDTSLEPQEYAGHRNCDTMKGVGFYGPNCEYVVSGSDCGRIFIWRKKDGMLLRAMEGDKYVVNCIEPHPHVPVLASSGIENDIKMWVPNAEERSPPINMAEVLNYTPKDSISFYFYDLMDEESYGDEFDEDGEDDDDNDGIDNSSDSGSDSPDDDDSDASGDLVFSDECMDDHLSDHYLASGNVDDVL